MYKKDSHDGRRVGENRKQHRARLRREGDSSPKCFKCGAPEWSVCVQSSWCPKQHYYPLPERCPKCGNTAGQPCISSIAAQCGRHTLYKELK